MYDKTHSQKHGSIDKMYYCALRRLSYVTEKTDRNHCALVIVFGEVHIYLKLLTDLLNRWIK